MKSISYNLRDQRGSITVFFVIFLLIASAAVTYALYVGRSTEEKMRTDTAADLSSLAMAQHAAMGLNMIAVNNLAIGGNLHVGASVPFLGRYYAVLLALYNYNSKSETASTIALGCPPIADLEQDVKDLNMGGTTADDSEFGNGFKNTKAITGFFIKTAAGMTTINSQMAKHWMRGGIAKGVEQLRLNKPGDVGLMVQASAANSIKDAAQFYDMKFKHLALSTPKQTMCQTIRSSEALGTSRNRVSLWLGGAVESMAGDSGVINTIQKIEGGLQDVGSTMSDQASSVTSQLESEVDQITGGLACGDDAIDDLELSSDDWDHLKNNCEQLSKLKSASPSSIFPEFHGCGLTDDGDFGKQFENFTNAKSAEKTAIGFVFPNVKGGNVKEFEESLQFAAAVGNPQYLFDEMPTKIRDGQKVTDCPDAWQVEVNGNKYCGVLLDGLDFGYASKKSEESDRDLASGGVGRAVGAGGGQNAGALNGIWKRVQWSIGQAKAEYEPGTGDPTFAALVSKADYENDDQRANKRRMQFFWPAWKARNAESTLLSTVLKLLGNK